MKLLFVYDCLYPESVGGVEHRNRELGMALARRGHEVTLAGWTRGFTPLAHGHGLRTLQMRLSGPIADGTGRRRPTAAIRFALAAAALPVQEYDVVETASIPYLHLFPLAARCKARGVPLVVTWYEFWGDYFGAKFGRARGLGFAAIERTAARLGTVCCAVSHLTAARLAGIRQTDVPVLPAGIHFDQLDIIRRSTTKEPGSLVYAGRLIEEKRVSLLLEALPGILAKAPAVTLAIIGDGPDRPRLEALSRSLGVSNRVRFLGHLPDSGEVFRVVASATIAVQLSRREGFGMFPLEAMALGAPLVYCESSESALGELVGSEAGVAVSPDPAAVGSAILRLLGDTGLREDASTHAVGRARGFDWDTVAARFENLVGDRSRSGI
jgi:glycosyltransferase involved in cell wall biosynthesis